MKFVKTEPHAIRVGKSRAAWRATQAAKRENASSSSDTPTGKALAKTAMIQPMA